MDWWFRLFVRRLAFGPLDILGAVTKHWERLVSDYASFGFVHFRPAGHEPAAGQNVAGIAEHG